MGGSGGGGYFSGSLNPDRLIASVRSAEQEAAGQEFTSQVCGFLAEALSQFNNRDVEGTHSILDKVKQELSEEFEDTVGLMFGGSVAKHTYVDGLSDVDALVVLKEAVVEDDSPVKLLGLFAEKLRARFGRSEDIVKEGQLAVTLKIGEKSIQLLPAMRSGEGFKISTPDGKHWSKINPHKFADKLTSANQALDGKLVPVIKLVKSINSTQPEQRQLTGYHIESMAINVFRGYDGPKNTKDMLQHFFTTAPGHCRKPIKDSTGQSVHVDEYLGEENSTQRLVVADALGRIGRRLANADGARSLEEWRSVLGIE